MDLKKKYSLPWIGGFFFLFLDQALKSLARNTPNTRVYLVDRWLGWEYFENTGIAFGIPFPQWFVIFFTPAILLLIGYLMFRAASLRMRTGLICLFFGALSNYIDRILFQKTIDYVRFATGIINIADVLIFIGILMLVLPKKSHPHT